MKKLLTLILTLLLLAGCSKGGGNINRNDYEKYGFISINFNNDDGESKEFWFAIDDSGKVKDATTAGWIAEFDNEKYKGNYQKAFDDVYGQFDGDSYSHIGFGFANMSEETEKRFRDECETYIKNKRPELPYETGTDDFERVFDKFVTYQKNKAKNAENQPHDDTPDQENHPEENNSDISLEVKSSEEFLAALTECGEIILETDISVDISNIKSDAIKTSRIECQNHSLAITGEYELNDNFKTIEINDVGSADISNLIIHADNLTPTDEILETNKLKYEELFAFNTNYKNVKYDSALLKDNSEYIWSRIKNNPYIDINNEGTRVTYMVKRAQTYEARHKQEMMWLEEYLGNPEEVGAKGIMEIYTDIELYFDDYGTPSDYEMSFDVRETGSLKISGKVYINGPKISIGSRTKGSVDLRDLTVIRKCMSPDCMKISCKEGIDESLLGVKTASGSKVVPGISENSYSITIWSKGE